MGFIQSFSPSRKVMANKTVVFCFVIPLYYTLYHIGLKQIIGYFRYTWIGNTSVPGIVSTKRSVIVICKKKCTLPEKLNIKREFLTNFYLRIDISET